MYQDNLNENCNFKLRNRSCMVTECFMGTILTETAIVGNLNAKCKFKLRNHSCRVTEFFMGTNLTEMAIDSYNFREISQLLQTI